MPPAMTPGGNPRGLGMALALLLDGFHGEGTAVACALPNPIALRRRAWMLRHALWAAHDRIGRPGAAPILAPCALHDVQGLLPPVKMVALEPRRLRDAPPAVAHCADAEAAPPHQQTPGAVSQGIKDPTQRHDLVLRHRAGERQGPEDVMAREPEGGLRAGALIAQEGKAPLHDAEASRPSTRGELWAEGGCKPCVKIAGGGLCQVRLASGLPRRGHEGRGAVERAEGGFLHGGGRGAGAQVGQRVGHQAVVLGTEAVQPAQRWEFLERGAGL